MKTKTVQRNGLIARIHVAKKQMAMDDDSYRGLLRRVGGAESCTAMDMHALERVISEFERLGFRKTGPKRAKREKLAGAPVATKIRALWMSLWNLGAIHDPGEPALEAFCKRMAGVEKLQWLTPSMADRVIRGLYGWLERAGWEQPVVRNEWTYRRALIEAQLRKLDIAYQEWAYASDVDLPNASIEHMDTIINLLGKQIRQGQ